VDRRKSGNAQGLKDDKKLDMPLQGVKRAATGGGRGKTGCKLHRTTEDHMEGAFGVSCSSNNKLGDAVA